MDNANTSIGDIERHFLATSMSSELQRYITLNAKVSRRVPEIPSRVVVFSSYQNRALVREMDSLCHSASDLVAKKCSTKEITSFHVSDLLIDAVSQVIEENKANREECERRLAKRQRFLRSMFVFDLIGSGNGAEALAGLADEPIFNVAVNDIWNNDTTAVVTVPGDDSLSLSFTPSGRTLVLLRKITQPLADAKSAYFGFGSDNACSMKLRGTSSARAFLNGPAHL